MSPEYRPLKKEEKDILISNNCLADDWDNMLVRENFEPAAISNTRFYGINKLGCCILNIEIDSGLSVSSGIYQTTLCNTTIGDNVYIDNVGLISNVDIRNNCIIRNTKEIVCYDSTTFGNGLYINALNESGGRSILIHEHLSSQQAFLMSLYRHDMAFIDALEELIKKFSKSQQSDKSIIDENTRIENCCVLKNIKTGPYSIIRGATYLENGTIQSISDSKTMIGQGAVLKDFIVQSGSYVGENVVLRHCFVGQSCNISSQFSAEHSVFFSNSEFMNGEACSVFAGPFSVSHHKSTLLIAGLFSFFNAGSGTNQSNHLYKLGPLHQGICERGVKTGSGSYLLWPSHIGAFSVVIGKHVQQIDTSFLPFSYILQEKDESYILPGMNLRSVGLFRDSKKWINRDKRTGKTIYDLCIPDVFSPYTCQKAILAIRFMEELEKKHPTSDKVSVSGVTVRKAYLKRAKKYYELITHYYFGREIINKLEIVLQNSADDFFSFKKSNYHTDWTDIGGLLSPKAIISDICEDIKNQRISSIEQLNSRFQQVFDQYEDNTWEWILENAHQMYGKSLSEFSNTELADLVRQYQKNAVELHNSWLNDARKEYADTIKHGYGLDGSGNEKELDFQNVRGTYKSDKTVLDIQQEIQKINEKVEFVINLLE